MESQEEYPPSPHSRLYYPSWNLPIFNEQEFANVDNETVEKKLKVYQEHINRRVALEWIRITGLENPYRKKMDKLLKDFAEDILKVPEDLKDYFSWPAPAGKTNEILAIRVKITYSFWKFFMATGRKNLVEYNKCNGKSIVICREKTITLQDEDRLGLYIRKKLRELYARKNKTCPDLSLRKSQLKFAKYEPMKPSLAAILLNIDLKDWTGLPVTSLLSDEEREKLEKGSIKRGSLSLPGIDEE